MNKERIGKFLKKLRTEKGLTLEQLSNEFIKDYLEVSPNAISGWEKGKSVPEINNLCFLASFYNVSIDEILDGEKNDDVDFGTIYPYHKEQWWNKYTINEETTLKELRIQETRGCLEIRKKFKSNILKYISGNISNYETKELIFFIENYYELSEGMDTNDYLEYLRELGSKRLNNDEKWWESQKNCWPLFILSVTYLNITDEGYKAEYVPMLLAGMDDWEKDALLTHVVINPPVFRDRHYLSSSKALMEYEKTNNKEYDVVQITKDTIKFLIDNGACINNLYIGDYEEKEGIDNNSVDYLEKKYNMYKKPFKLCLHDENKKNLHFYVENTERNRFFVCCMNSVVMGLQNYGYTYDEIYDLVQKNDDVPDEVYIRAAKYKKIDTNRPSKYIKADLYYELLPIVEYWAKYKSNKMFRINDDFNEDEYCVYADYARLYKENEHTDVEQRVHEVNMEISYKNYINNRDNTKTNELLSNLDNLSVNEIRNVYFGFGGDRNA